MQGADLKLEWLSVSTDKALTNGSTIDSFDARRLQELQHGYKEPLGDLTVQEVVDAP